MSHHSGSNPSAIDVEVVGLATKLGALSLERATRPANVIHLQATILAVLSYRGANFRRSTEGSATREREAARVVRLGFAMEPLKSAIEGSAEEAEVLDRIVDVGVAVSAPLTHLRSGSGSGTEMGTCARS